MLDGNKNTTKSLHYLMQNLHYRGQDIVSSLFKVVCFFNFKQIKMYFINKIINKNT